jgi:DNA-directed RNA polymerase specialized sigma24 family protein
MMGGTIAAALDSLPADFREILMLVDVQELNYEEAAQFLRVPIGTVKSRVSRGRAMMRHALSKLARVQGLAVSRPRLRYTSRAVAPIVLTA